MIPKTADQWRKAIKERRIAHIRADHENIFLDDVAKELADLPHVEDWMVRGLLNAAVEEWESRLHHYRVDYDWIEAQNARRAADRRNGKDDPALF